MDQGWYWYDMELYLTDPSLETFGGRVEMDGESDDIEGRYALYGYDAQGRVVTIDTYDMDGVLLGYCVVTYQA